MRADSLDGLEACEPLRRSNGPSCEMVADHIMQIVDREWARGITELPEEDRQRMRERLASKRDQYRGEFLEMCGYAFQAEVRVCWIQAGSLDDLGRCPAPPDLVEDAAAEVDADAL